MCARLEERSHATGRFMPQMRNIELLGATLLLWVRSALSGVMFPLWCLDGIIVSLLYQLRTTDRTDSSTTGKAA